MAQMTPWVHTYTLRDLLDDSFDLFKEQAVNLLLAGVIPFVLVAVYTAFMRLFVIPESFLRTFTWDAASAMLTNGRFWLYLTGLTLCSTAAMSVSYLAQCKIAILHAYGETITLQRVFSRLVRPVFSLLINGIIFGILGAVVSTLVALVVGFIGLILGVVLGALLSVGGGEVVGVIYLLVIIVSGSLSFVITVTPFLAVPIFLVFDDLGPFAAFGESWRIGLHRFKEYAGAVIVFTTFPLLFIPFIALLGFGLLQVTQYLAPSVSVMIIATLLCGLTSVLFCAMFASLQALVYLDGKCRLDNLDLRLMARQMGLGEEFDQALLVAPGAVSPTAYFPDYTAPAPRTPEALPTTRTTAPVAATAQVDYSRPPEPLPASSPPDYSQPPEPAARKEEQDAG